jgi:hypothetical protein
MDTNQAKVEQQAEDEQKEDTRPGQPVVEAARPISNVEDPDPELIGSGPWSSDVTRCKLFRNLCN